MRDQPVRLTVVEGTLSTLCSSTSSAWLQLVSLKLLAGTDLESPICLISDNCFPYHAADDALSDDLESYQSIVLPAPELGNLPDIEEIVRAASMTQTGRDALSKFIIRDEYIGKLVPLVTMAEDLESLEDLHRLCNIMKSLILLNDNTIIETVVADQIILGVVGALECTVTSSSQPWVRNSLRILQMTLNFRCTRQIIGSTSQISHATKRSFQSRTR